LKTQAYKHGVLEGVISGGTTSKIPSAPTVEAANRAEGSPDMNREGGKVRENVIVHIISMMEIIS